MRWTLLVVTTALMLSGSACGGAERVTQEDLGRMGEEDVLAMGSCQLQKLQEAEGPEAVSRFTDEMVEGLEEEAESGDVVPVQIELSERGYNCPEYLPE